jgi:hypothetical protein
VASRQPFRFTRISLVARRDACEAKRPSRRIFATAKRFKTFTKELHRPFQFRFGEFANGLVGCDAFLTGAATVLYITSSRLMRESEDAVREHASSRDEVPRRVCSQLLASEPRYGEWHARHEVKMQAVARPRRRDPQIQALRGVAVEQVHRTALVSFLRQNRVTGKLRDRTLGLFHGISDVRDATLAEHRVYLIAASTQICAYDLLDLVGDTEGLDLIRRYELAYAQYFAMFCERAIALQTGNSYLLESLLPEVTSVADRLRLRIVGAPQRTMVPRRRPQAVLHHGAPARPTAGAARRPSWP